MFWCMVIVRCIWKKGEYLILPRVILKVTTWPLNAPGAEEAYLNIFLPKFTAQSQHKSIWLAIQILVCTCSHTKYCAATKKLKDRWIFTRLSHDSDLHLKVTPSWDKRVKIHLSYLTPRWIMYTSLMTKKIKFYPQVRWKLDKATTVTVSPGWI